MSLVRGRWFPDREKLWLKCRLGVRLEFTQIPQVTLEIISKDRKAVNSYFLLIPVFFPSKPVLFFDFELSHTGVLSHVPVPFRVSLFQVEFWV